MCGAQGGQKGPFEKKRRLPATSMSISHIALPIIQSQHAAAELVVLIVSPWSLCMHLQQDLLLA